MSLYCLVLCHVHMSYSSFMTDQFIYSSRVTFRSRQLSAYNVDCFYMNVCAYTADPIHHVSLACFRLAIF